MRGFLLIISILLFESCQKNTTLSLKHSNWNKTIAIQPLGEFDKQDLVLLQSELTDFYKCRVELRDVVDVPASCIIPGDVGYLADSILSFLDKFRNDSIVEVVGLTHKEIYIITEASPHISENDSLNYYFDPVIGLGYVSRGACVISDRKIILHKDSLYSNRLKKAVFHEIGHNLGLDHCKVKDCLMSEENKKISALSKPGCDYCENCRRKIN